MLHHPCKQGCSAAWVDAPPAPGRRCSDLALTRRSQAAPALGAGGPGSACCSVWLSCLSLFLSGTGLSAWFSWPRRVKMTVGFLVERPQFVFPQDQVQGCIFGRNIAEVVLCPPASYQVAHKLGLVHLLIMQTWITWLRFSRLSHQLWFSHCRKRIPSFSYFPVACGSYGLMTFYLSGL